MRAKEYWVIMWSSLVPDISEHLVSDDYNCEAKYNTKNEALVRIAELTAVFPASVYTLYHLVPTEHTTHKR